MRDSKSSDISFKEEAERCASAAARDIRRAGWNKITTKTSYRAVRCKHLLACAATSHSSCLSASSNQIAITPNLNEGVQFSSYVELNLPKTVHTRPFCNNYSLLCNSSTEVPG